jgi:hypothetical protein
MSGHEHSSRLGRFAVLAALSASVALFLTSLSGIASIDPSAGATGSGGAPASAPAVHGVSLDRHARQHRRDCPRHHKDAARPDFSS